MKADKTYCVADLDAYVKEYNQEQVRIGLEQALNYRFIDDGIKVTIVNNEIRFEGNTKYTKEELINIVNKVKKGNFE